jgi:hypothetical protein
MGHRDLVVADRGDEGSLRLGVFGSGVGDVVDGGCF